MNEGGKAEEKNKDEEEEPKKETRDEKETTLPPPPSFTEIVLRVYMLVRDAHTSSVAISQALIVMNE